MLPAWFDFGTGMFMFGQAYSVQGNRAYFIGQALSYLLILVAQKYPVSKPVRSIVIWFAISNVADELFFNPLVLGLNELIFGIFIVSYILYEYRRKRSI